MNRKILRAAMTVASLTVVARLVSLLKELIVARAFGRGDDLDAYLIAFVLPSFVTMLMMGAVGSAFVPVLIETRHRQGPELADRLLSAVFLISAATLTLVAILAGVLAPWYLPFLGHGFTPEKLRLTRELLYLLLPWLVFNGLASFGSSVLNASEKFGLPTLLSALTPFLTIVLVLYMARSWGPFVLAAGTTAGGICESAFMFYLLRGEGIRLRRRWDGVGPELSAVLRQCAPVLGGSFLMGTTLVVDQSMAAMLPPGSVAALGYANKLVAGIAAISATALGTAVFPYFSKMVAAQDWPGCRHTLERYFAVITAVTVPMTAGLILFSHLIVRLLYQRGAFTPHDTDLVSFVLRCYALQIPVYMLSILFVRFLSAMKRNEVLLVAAAVNLVFDVVLNLIFMRIWGVAGIALSTSFVYLVSLIILATWSRRILTGKRYAEFAAAGAASP